MTSEERVCWAQVNQVLISIHFCLFLRVSEDKAKSVPENRARNITRVHTNNSVPLQYLLMLACFFDPRILPICMEHCATLFSVPVTVHRPKANWGREGYVSYFIIHLQGKPRQELKTRATMEESCLLSWSLWFSRCTFLYNPRPLAQEWHWDTGIGPPISTIHWENAP